MVGHGGRTSDAAGAPENLMPTPSRGTDRHSQMASGRGSAALWAEAQYYTASTAQKGGNPVVGEPMVFKRASNYFGGSDDEVEAAQRVNPAEAQLQERLGEMEAEGHLQRAFANRNSDALNELYMSQLPLDKQSQHLI